jgi:hypothetical protein
MSSNVMVNMSGPKNQNDRLSRCQCTHPPSKPRIRKIVASVTWSAGISPCASRSHCHLKYIHHMPICAPMGAWRSITGGLPYCSRLKLYLNACHVPFEKVQSALSSVRQAVGSPSLMAGKNAARMGCVAKGVMPSSAAAAAASSSFHRTSVRGRRMRTAIATAGAASMPAMWFE